MVYLLKMVVMTNSSPWYSLPILIAWWIFPWLAVLVITRLYIEQLLVGRLRWKNKVGSPRLRFEYRWLYFLWVKQLVNQLLDPKCEPWCWNMNPYIWYKTVLFLFFFLMYKYSSTMVRIWGWMGIFTKNARVWVKSRVRNEAENTLMNSMGSRCLSMSGRFDVPVAIELVTSKPPWKIWNEPTIHGFPAKFELKMPPRRCNDCVVNVEHVGPWGPTVMFVGL